MCGVSGVCGSADAAGRRHSMRHVGPCAHVPLYRRGQLDGMQAPRPQERSHSRLWVQCLNKGRASFASAAGWHWRVDAAKYCAAQGARRARDGVASSRRRRVAVDGQRGLAP